MSRGDESNFYPLLIQYLKSQEPNKLHFLTFLQNIADEKGKLNGGGVPEFSNIRDGMYGFFFIAPASYKKLHIHCFLKWDIEPTKVHPKLNNAIVSTIVYNNFTIVKLEN